MEDSITIALREKRRQRVEWIHLVQDWDRAGIYEEGNEHSRSTKRGEFLD